MSFVPRYLSEGRICCSQPHALCDNCKAHHAQFNRKDDTMEDFAPPDPYAPALRALHNEESFEERYKAGRLRELDREHAQMAARRVQPRLTAAQVAEFAPPDGYQLALTAMKEAQ